MVMVFRSRVARMKLKDCRPHRPMQPVDLGASGLHDPTTEVPTAQPLRQ